MKYDSRRQKRKFQFVTQRYVRYTSLAQDEGLTPLPYNKFAEYAYAKTDEEILSITRRGANGN